MMTLIYSVLVSIKIMIMKATFLNNGFFKNLFIMVKVFRNFKIIKLKFINFKTKSISPYIFLKLSPNFGFIFKGVIFIFLQSN